MRKIPVGQTIAYAYRFTFDNLGAIIGLIWLPTVLAAIGGYFTESYYGAAIDGAMAQGRPAAAGQAVLSLLAWGLVSLLLYAIMYAAVTRQALGLRKGPAFVHFALGVPEFKLFGAQLGLIGLVVAFFVIYAVGLAALGIAGANAGGAKLGVSFVAGVFALAGIGFILYAMVRLSFLLFPATVAEEKIGLSRSWTLTQGNFWRIVVIGLATLGPLAIAAAIGEYFILGKAFFATYEQLASADKAVQEQASQLQSHMTQAHLPMLVGLSLILAPFTAGLSLGPAAFAYRAVTGSPPLPGANSSDRPPG